MDRLLFYPLHIGLLVLQNPHLTQIICILNLCIDLCLLSPRTIYLQDCRDTKGFIFSPRFYSPQAA